MAWWSNWARFEIVHARPRLAICMRSVRQRERHRTKRLWRKSCQRQKLHLSPDLPLVQAMVGVPSRAKLHVARVDSSATRFVPWNRDDLLASLEANLTNIRPCKDGNLERPEGGFFLTMTLPFAFGRRMMSVRVTMA